MSRRGPSGAITAIATLALLGASGCATLGESTQQQVLVQTVLDYREVAGIGCVLYNDVGKWFVTTPARLMIRKSAGALRIDCKQQGNDSAGWAYEKIDSKVGASLWGNLILTAGVGYFVDKNTGAGYDYPSTLTVIMHRPADGDNRAPPAPGTLLY